MLWLTVLWLPTPWLIGCGGSSVQIAEKEWDEDSGHRALIELDRAELSATGIARSQERLFASTAEGLVVLDAGTLEELGRIALPGEPQGVATDGLLALLPAASGDLHVVEVEDSPQLLASVSVTGPARAVAFDGDRAWVLTGMEEAESKLGIAVVDLADPPAPTQLAFVATAGEASGVVVHQDHLLIADGSAGVAVFSQGDPAPVELGRLPSAAASHAVSARDDTVWVADDSGGVLRLDISDPSEPYQLEGWPTPGAARDVVAVRDELWTATDEGVVVTSQEGAELAELPDPGRCDQVLVGELTAWARTPEAILLLQRPD